MGGMLGLIECYIILTVCACIQACMACSELPCITQHAHMQTYYAHPISEQDIAMEEVLHIVQRRLWIKWK